jgi:hypothetical protein
MSGYPLPSSRYRLGCTPNISWQRWEPFFEEAAVERGVVGDDEHYPAQQIVDGSIVNAVTGDQMIGNAGNGRDFRQNGKARIFGPLPGGENFVDPPALTVVFEEADAELDDLVAIGVGAGGLDIHDGRLLGLWAATRLLGEIGGLED